MRWFKLSLLIIFCVSALAALLPTGRAQQGEQAAFFEQKVLPFFAENCVGCHSAKSPAGGLNVERFTSAADVVAHREAWEHIIQRMRTGEMPPKSMPRPAIADVEAIARWVEGQIAAADAQAKPDPGRITARRLNRTEYNNTIRDLLGVDIDAANDFPQDDSAYGFDNIADALTLSPTLMEKYLAAAEKISKVALFGPEVKTQSWRVEPTRPRRMEINPVKIEQPPFWTMHDYDRTGISHPGSYHTTRKFPAGGEYLFRVRADGAKPAGSEPQMLDLYLDGKIVKSFEVVKKVTATNETLPVFFEVRLPVTAGEHQLIAAFPNLFDGLPPNFNGPNPSKLPQPPPPDPEKFFPPLKPDATPAQIEARKATIERIRNRKPVFEGIAVAELEIIGPYNYTKAPSPESLRKIYVCGHLDGNHQAGCERKIVANLAHRAFRRPVEKSELDNLTAIVTQARTRGRSFEQAIALAVQAVLISPDFLFRIEQDRAPKAAERAVENSFQISQHEIASRLSYFLWSSMPDDALLRAADQGKLREPAVLKAQVQRMLRSEKAKALVENFGGQWLETRRLESVQPDRDRFPDFDDYLRTSMQRETELFLQNVMQNDGSLLDFIDAKYSFLNERLARHYGIKGVAGPEFRKVSLEGTKRGGLLTQASVLTVSSYGNRTSPVLRGKWVLENMLNAPPPPPPGNVPPLDESAVGAKGTLKQQMEQHRKNPVCASCHARMDPIGFALENFDAVGGWRAQDGKFPIDPSGALPDGRAINGADDLLAVIKNERNAFTEALTEKLLIYALGRGLERHDHKVIKQITAKVARQDYHFSGLVLEIVNSLPFQYRRL